MTEQPLPPADTASRNDNAENGASPSRRSACQRWLRLTLLSWLTLIALLLVWHQRIPTPQPLPALALALIPLLVPAPWLVRGSRGAILTIAVIALLYFCHAVVELTSPLGETLWASAELLVSLCLFTSSTLTARLLR